MSVATTNFLFNGGAISGDFAPETIEEGALANPSGEVINIQVDGTVGGTIYLEGKINLKSAEWVQIAVLDTKFVKSDTITDVGGYFGSVDGMQLVRVRCEGVTDATIFARITKGA